MPVYKQHVVACTIGYIMIRRIKFHEIYIIHNVTPLQTSPWHGIINTRYLNIYSGAEWPLMWLTRSQDPRPPGRTRPAAPAPAAACPAARRAGRRGRSGGYTSRAARRSSCADPCDKKTDINSVIAITWRY